MSETLKSIFSVILILLFTQSPLLAQSQGPSSWVNIGLFAFIAILILYAVSLVGNNLMGIEEKKAGIQHRDSGIFGSLKRIFSKPAPDYVEGDLVTTTKGHNIHLQGEAVEELVPAHTSRYSMQPQNYIGISPIPKLHVEVGEEVLAGQPIFFDKKRPEIQYVAPVSGEVVEVIRGDKRAITNIVILADKTIRYKELPKIDLSTVSREDLVGYLLNNGLWALLEQRPYNIIPFPETVPENIFISTFDTAPLAPDLNFLIQGKEKEFQTGIDALNLLTEGSVHLGLSANGPEAPAEAFTNATNVQKHWFRGLHPIGNVGVQIHHIAPVSLNSPAFTLDVQSVVMIGKAILERKYDASRIVALTGSVNQPQYVKTYMGANLEELMQGQLEGRENVRIISGDVLSGDQKSNHDFLNQHDDQITVIPEGNEYELFGWLVPSKMRPTVSKTYPNFLFGDMKFEGETNTHGEQRAFVMTGQYESMLPMDIYPQHLMKAILANDFEKMEGLGLLELSEEDIALAEFACTSKQPLQKILRDGLDAMREQG